MTLTFRLMLSANLLTWPWVGLDFLHALPIDFLYWHCKNAKLLANEEKLWEHKSLQSNQSFNN